MIAKVGQHLSRFSARWVPDPFVLALAITVVVGAISCVRVATLGGDVFRVVGGGWLAGFSSTSGLEFALQMCLVLVTGHAIATSPPVQRCIRWLAAVPGSSASAAALVAVFAMAAAVIHWGLGAIAGALLAREIGRHASSRGLAVHYPLLGAAAYSGLAVWHGGLSGSAPLKVAGGMGLEYTGEIALWSLLMSPLNLAVTGSLLVVLPWVFSRLSPADPDDFILPPELPAITTSTGSVVGSRALVLSHNPWIGRWVGILGLVFVGTAIAITDLRFAINSVNMMFLFGGIALHGGLSNYMASATEGARAAGAIIIQFPLYSGILGLLKAGALIEAVSGWFASVSGTATFPLLTFASAGAVNLCVPSGGGQWVLQSDILLSAGNTLGVDPVTTIMAFSYGDAWTNMLQPFWALPLLGIMGLRAKDIIGYTAVAFVTMAFVVPCWLLILG